MGCLAITIKWIEGHDTLRTHTFRIMFHTSFSSDELLRWLDSEQILCHPEESIPQDRDYYVSAKRAMGGASEVRINWASESESAWHTLVLYQQFHQLNYSITHEHLFHGWCGATPDRIRTTLWVSDLMRNFVRHYQPYTPALNDDTVGDPDIPF